MFFCFLKIVIFCVLFFLQICFFFEYLCVGFVYVSIRKIECLFTTAQLFSFCMMYPYFLLFGTSFAASSVLPLASDGFLVGMVLKNFNPWVCLLVATAGNWLGGMTSYGMGWLGRWQWLEKYLGVSQQKIEKVRHYFDRYGAWLALACWLPFVGDVLVVALGFWRVRPVAVALLMLFARFARYAVEVAGVVFVQ